MSKKNAFLIIFHLFCWIIVALPSVIFVPQRIQYDAVMYLIRLCFPAFMCVIFYLNYFWLAPRCIISSRRKNVYIVINAFVITILAICMQFMMDYIHIREMEAGWTPPQHERFTKMSVFLSLTIRNGCSFAFSAAVGTLLCLAMKWQKAEAARREMEIQKTEAELKNLRNQINPHFLLNTLNNIYALISFDQSKAQKAVLSLSALLRQMLYGTQKNAINLKEEADFITHYVDLMRIRTGENVNIKLNISIPPSNDIFIAPVILISLVENAFKHGISPTMTSFISINLFSDGEKIEFEIKNSNFPKNNSDKSGHGIGLKQVAKRLDLAYKDKYEWIKGVDDLNKVYYSKIIIYDIKLCDNR